MPCQKQSESNCWCEDCLKPALKMPTRDKPFSEHLDKDLRKLCHQAIDTIKPRAIDTSTEDGRALRAVLRIAIDAASNEQIVELVIGAISQSLNWTDPE